MVKCKEYCRHCDGAASCWYIVQALPLLFLQPKSTSHTGEMHKGVMATNDGACPDALMLLLSGKDQLLCHRLQEQQTLLVHVNKLLETTGCIRL